VVRATAEKRNLELPFIVMEPGRSIVASTGLTLYTAGNVKEIKDVRTYVSVDGGMADNPRHIMYQSVYEAVMPEKPNAPLTQVVTIAGKCCESGDILISDAHMPEIKPGDLIAILATGAYNYSMASNYNRIPRPPIIMTSKGKTTVAVKRESYEDLVNNDL
ncbi:MAG: diaminopimelate decarboxylase, partial [Oscillospiraceae bacterium]